MIVKLTNVRLAFPQLFEAKAVNGEGEPRFGAAFIIEPGSANAKALAEALKAVATEKWGAKGAGTLADLQSKGKVCYQERPKTNASGEIYDGFDGKYHVNASTTQRPQVIDRDTTPLTAADGRPYGGCFVDASLDIWPQDNSWGKRVNAKLRWVQFRADGAGFSGSPAVSQDEFEAIEGADAADLV